MCLAILGLLLHDVELGAQGGLLSLQRREVLAELFERQQLVLIGNDEAISRLGLLVQ